MTRKRDELLDHDADGIQEFDNDLPRWWLYGFYFTILLGAVYWVNFHVLPEPLVGEATVVAEYDADVRRAGSRPSAPAPAGAPVGGAAAVAVKTGFGKSIIKFLIQGGVALAGAAGANLKRMRRRATPPESSPG